MNEQHKQTIREALTTARRVCLTSIPLFNQYEQDRLLGEMRSIDAALAALDEPEWTPVSSCVNEIGMYIEVDDIAIAIHEEDYVLARFAWPDDGEYKVFRRTPHA